jgi:drug/metabolite transporter (DMT)-like permease
MKKSLVFMAVLSAVFFGMSTPAGKLLLRHIEYFELAGLLYLGAALGVLPVAVYQLRKKNFHVDRKNFIRLAGAVVFGGILGPVFLLGGLRMASASSVSLWLNFELVATALLGVLFFRDHLSSLGWLGVAGALLAGILITLQEGSSGFLSLSLVLLACLFWGLDNHLTALIDALTPAQTTFLKGLIAGSTNFVIGSSVARRLPDFGTAGVALVVGIFAYGLSIVLYINAAQGLGATRSQILFASAPFFGVLFSVIFLSEELSWIQIGAAFILAASILFIIFNRHSHLHEHEEMEHIHMHHHDDSHHDHVHLPGESAGRHSHLHRHKKERHSHIHYPDVHHRHGHEKRESERSQGTESGK